MRLIDVVIHVITQGVGLAIVFELVESKPRTTGLIALIATFVIDIWIARWLIRQIAPRRLPAEREIDEDPDQKK